MASIAQGRSGSKGITRRSFLGRGVLGAAGVSLLSHGLAGRLLSAEGHRKRPDVVFIICDDLNDSIASMGGHPQARTPNIDRLMKRGVRFVNCQSNDPICGPSRASLWSGLYPHTTGYFGYQQQANPWRKNPVLSNAVTLFEHAVANGYAVYATGKIHHNGHEDWSVFTNRDGTSGFNIKPSFGPFPWDGDPAQQTWGLLHPHMPQGFKGKWDASFGPVVDISQAFGGKGQWIDRQRPWRYVSDDDRDAMPDELCAEYAAKVLQQDHADPFLLTVGFNRPHAPLHVPKKYFDLFPLDQVQPAAALTGDIQDCAKILVKNYAIGTGAGGFIKYRAVMGAGGEDLLKRWTQAYLACVAFVDEQVGKVLAALEKSAYADNTLVVFTSDNGYHMGQKEQLFKNSVWEESTRLPLVLAGPGVAAGQQCTHPVSLIDLYPTLVDYCQLPAHPNQKTNGKSLDGHSIRPFLEDPTNGRWDGPSVALSVVAGNDTLQPNEPGKVDRQHFSVRSDRYRYILCNNGEEELYDHQADPHEWKNLAGEAAHAQAKQELRRELESIVGRALSPASAPAPS